MAAVARKSEKVPSTTPPRHALNSKPLVARRGYAFANHVTGYNLDVTGQEGFSVIKYGSDDEYRPHCDGDCTGAEFRKGGRVATMVRALML